MAFQQVYHYDVRCIDFSTNAILRTINTKIDVVGHAWNLHLAWKATDGTLARVSHSAIAFGHPRDENGRPITHRSKPPTSFLMGDTFVLVDTTALHPGSGGRVELSSSKRRRIDEISKTREDLLSVVVLDEAQGVKNRGTMLSSLKWTALPKRISDESPLRTLLT